MHTGVETGQKEAPDHYRGEFILRGTTNKKGNFTLKHASDGQWTIRAVGGTPQPYFVRPFEVTVTENESVDLSEILAEPGFCLTGAYATQYEIGLKRSGSKYPIRVSIRRPRIPGWELRTGEDGTFAIWGLPCGAEGDINFYSISGFHEIVEAPESCSFVRIFPQGRMRFNKVPPGVYDGFKVQFLLSGLIRGRVVDPSGDPLSKLKMVIRPGGSIHSTDSQGKFSGQIPPVNQVTVDIQDPTTSKSIYTSRPFDVEEGELVELKIVINGLR